MLGEATGESSSHNPNERPHSKRCPTEALFWQTFSDCDLKVNQKGHLALRVGLKKGFRAKHLEYFTASCAPL